MEVGIEAARWVVGRALSPVSGGVLEAWAASSELGPNIEALKEELLYAQAMLYNARGNDHGREIKNPALSELLHKLWNLAYRADDVLDELDYFRIQDELDDTYHAADEHDGGCLHNHAHNARHTGRAIAKMLGFSKSSRGSASHNEPDEDTRGACWPCLGLTTPPDNEQEEDASRGVLCGALWPCGRASSTPATNLGDQEVGDGCMGRLASGARNAIYTVGKHLPCHSASPDENDANSNITPSGRRYLCCARPSKAPQKEHVLQTPKLKFNRVEMSQSMKKIVEQLKPVCAKVSTILNLELLDSNRRNATSRPITTSELIEPEFYGRNDERSKIIKDTVGKYCDRDLTVLPIVGPGGIGKTTLTQYIYKELQNHFEVKLWVCVSVNFNAYRVTQEIADILTNGEKGSPYKLVEERLKSKSFLLVLDDMWSCRNEDEWRRFLVPFTRGQTKGSVIVVTTRFPALAQMVMVKTTDDRIDLEGLDSEAFKDLFFAYVFDDKQSRNDYSGLLDTGDRIMQKLKGSPLAAKTVGRLLRNHLDLDHWTRVLESKEWESQNDDDDIMPALKLSFDYLPFHLQQCFTYSTLFPEDYKFSCEELIHLWIGLDVLHSRGENKRIEDIGLSHLTELINYGFFKKEKDDGGCTRYLIHDLLHELALKVSAHECLSIYSSNVRSTQIPPSIRHLSINIDDSSVKDRKTFDICREDFSALGKRLMVENLHSLMLFGKHQGSFVKTFHGLFSKAKALRVIFLSKASYTIEDLLHNFLELVHLRYLRIHNGHYDPKSPPPKSISRFYHLRVLDVQGRYNALPRDMSNLVKLRHFLIPDDEMNSSIFEVGRLKSLQELRRFVVKKESQGFELSQLGHLLELSGSLHIDNLEKVEARQEADEAKLMHKNHLHELILDWDTNRSNKDPALEEQVLEGLKPASNLQKLCIRGHGGPTCPSWLGMNLSVKNLESLHLDGVAWRRFPPIGQMFLVNERGKEFPSNISDQNFHNLRRIELENIAGLKKWVVDGTCQIFSHLEVLIMKGCSELVEMSFSRSICSQQEQQTWFPRLQELVIHDCPKLLSFPPIPWTRAPCSVSIGGTGLGFQNLAYGMRYESALSLRITGKDGEGSGFWTTLDFPNLTELKELNMQSCPPLPLDRLQMLSSLKTLSISHSNNVFWPVEDGSHVGYQFPVESMDIRGLDASGKELTQFLSYMPKLSKLEISGCNKITGLGVVEQQEKETSSSNEVEAQSGRQEKSREEEEIAAEGLLLLPPQLQELQIWYCLDLSLNPGWLQGLCSLRSLRIWGCPKFLSCYLPSSSSCFPFPTSLQFLVLTDVEPLAPLSNLASLTFLMISSCGDSRGVGLWRLLAQGCLTELRVLNTPNLFVASSEPSQLHGQGLPSPSYKLQSLSTDDIVGVLSAPICSLLSSSLTRLCLTSNYEMECFTEEQEEALQRLTSLQKLEFRDCGKLQGLPAGLSSLKRLWIDDCPAIRSLPKDGLPNSLEELDIHNCPGIRSLPKEGLPNSLEELQIWGCPGMRTLPKDGLPDSLQELQIVGCKAIRTLPKGGLPSSLRVLDVRFGNSEELRRQCRKLIGTIPIVVAD